MSETWRGRTTNAPRGDWAVSEIGRDSEPGYLRRAREHLAEEICKENGINTSPDYHVTALELLRLLYQLDQQPGNRVLILRRVTEIERELGLQ